MLADLFGVPAAGSRPRLHLLFGCRVAAAAAADVTASKLAVTADALAFCRDLREAVARYADGGPDPAWTWYGDLTAAAARMRDRVRVAARTSNVMAGLPTGHLALSHGSLVQCAFATTTALVEFRNAAHLPDADDPAAAFFTDDAGWRTCAYHADHHSSAADADAVQLTHVEILTAVVMPGRAWDPAWRTSAVAALAASMYAADDFSASPILADALQEAGCEDDDILGRLRRGVGLFRGCWVVDKATGRR